MIVAVVGVAGGIPVRFIISSSGVRAEGMRFITSSGSVGHATALLMELVVGKLRPGNSLWSFT